MTAWQRQASGIAGLGDVGGGSVANGIGAGVPMCDRAPRFSWEDWFLHATAQQRADALGLAERQGVLYSHQLPHLSNGKKPTTAAPETGLASLLTRLMSGKCDALFPSDSLPVPIFDSELDEVQQQAVQRALGTPDVFLLEGLPGTGKSRVVAEIILQTALRGGRVLFLAAQTASLDVVLHRLVARDGAFPIRYLEPAEKLASLPAWLRGFTLEEQRQSFAQRAVVGARNNREQAEARCRSRRDEEPIWSELQEAVCQTRACDRSIAALRERLHGLASAVETEATAADSASPFAARSAQHRQALERTLQELDVLVQERRDTLAKNTQETEQLVRRIAELDPAYQAKKGNRFWTAAFWAHLFNSHILQEMDSAQSRRRELETARQHLEQEIARLGQSRASHQERASAEHAAFVRDEIQARQIALSREIETLQRARDEQSERWNGLCQRVASLRDGQRDGRAAEPTDASLAAARQSWLRHKEVDDEQCRFAHLWARYVEEAGAELIARVPMLANVSAATITTWQTCPQCREAATAPFDLLIIEDADTLTESDLTKLARHAPRCVLVAGAYSLPSSVGEREGAPRSVEKAARSFAGMPLASALCWPRLWQALAGAPVDSPCSWFRDPPTDTGRLVCQLVPLTKEDRQHLDSEGLADAADIELRILHRPNATPRLAQLVFPACWSFQDALAFVVREAQEIPLQPLGYTTWWREDALRWSWQAAPSSDRVHMWLEADAGVRIGMISHSYAERGNEGLRDSARVACIEFAKSAGWDRARAEAWMQRYHRRCESGRAVFLQTPHRFTASLANIVVSFAGAGSLPGSAWEREDPGQPRDESFEFCAVPPSKSADVPKDGGGLELDLAATRHVDRLPSEFRQGLPARGIVNFLEAQALVRRLESLLQSEPAKLGPACHVAVLALYESQAELLRRLIASSRPLRSRPFTLEVALPSRMHQRECDIVLLSLTRSHAHRCVAFGDDPRELAIALTRASTRLLVFGDIGMLAKRTHWTGPLDHLDLHASHQERQRLTRLLALAHPVSMAMSNGTTNGKG